LFHPLKRNSNRAEEKDKEVLKKSKKFDDNKNISDSFNPVTLVLLYSCIVVNTFPEKANIIYWFKN